MRMKKNEAVSEMVWNKIVKRGPGTTWTYLDFKELPFTAVSKALSRLVAGNKLNRPRKGIYHYPKETALGKTNASSIEIINKIAHKNGLKIFVDPNTAAYNLRITTQVPANVTLAGSTVNRYIHLPSGKVRLIKRNLKHLKNATNEEIYFLETLRGIKSIPGVTPTEAIDRLKLIMKSMNIENLLTLALDEPPRIRAMTGSLATDLKFKSAKLKSLHESLNSLSKYKLGLKNSLKSHKEWNIV